MSQSHAIAWFEIPAADLPRATRFYQTILDLPLRGDSMEGMPMSIFPHGDRQVGGCLIQHPTYQPSAQGTVPYLNAGESLDIVLSRVAGAGGQVVFPKTMLPDGMGCFAQIVDTEGNRVGLHALH